MLDKKQIITTTEVRQKLNKLIKSVQEEGDVFYIFDRSTPKAVLMDVDNYTDMVKSLNDLQDMYELLLAENEETEDFVNYDKKRRDR